jgi:tetratricopeptide (TPR) repeat protein
MKNRSLAFLAGWKSIKYLIPIYLLGLSFWCFAQSVPSEPEEIFISYPLQSSSEWDNLSLQELETKIMEAKGREEIKNKESLQVAKHYLFDGDFGRALLYLDKVNSKGHFLLVKKRYLATIYFLQGKYPEVLEILNDRKFLITYRYGEICLLKIMSLLAMENYTQAYNEQFACFERVEAYSQNNLFWINSAIRYHGSRMTNEETYAFLRPSDPLLLYKNEYVRPWLKWGIYSGRSEVINEMLGLVNASVFQSNSIRELIGLIYYRLNDWKKATEFIEDLETVNAENIKGNMLLAEKKYELAYAHFQSALQKKNNSANALERVLPLTIMLEQWSEGLKFSDQLINTPTDQEVLLTLQSYFLLHLGDYQQALNKLGQVKKEFRRRPSLKFTLMRSFLSLMENNREDMLLAAEDSCKRFDGLNCWLLASSLNWPDLKALLVKEEITRPKENIQTFKESQDLKPFEEELVIDQSDIEELDTKILSLTPEK